MGKYDTSIQRFFAVILDGIIFFPLSFLDGLQSPSYSEVLAFFSVLASLFLPVIYSIFFVYRYGATLGKMAVKIKVVSIDEEKSVGIKQSIIRQSPAIVFNILWLLILAIFNGTFHETDDISAIELIIFAMGLAWFVAEIVCMYNSDKLRSAHDIMAGTVVIRTNRPDTA